jgi:hypothetical protein
MSTHDPRPADPHSGARLTALEQQLHDRIVAATAARREPRVAARRLGGSGAERDR